MTSQESVADVQESLLSVKEREEETMKEILEEIDHTEIIICNLARSFTSDLRRYFLREGETLSSLSSVVESSIRALKVSQNNMYQLKQAFLDFQQSTANILISKSESEEKLLKPSNFI